MWKTLVSVTGKYVRIKHPANKIIKNPQQLYLFMTTMLI